MRRSLEETVITGVETTLPIQHLILFQQDFLRGNYHTGFMEKYLDDFLKIYLEAGGKNESI